MYKKVDYIEENYTYETVYKAGKPYENKISAYIRGTWELSSGKYWTADEIRTDLLNEINISFSNIDSTGKAYLNNEDYIKTQVKELLEKKPDLKISLSIGGWGEAGFSNASANPKNREIFCESVMVLLNKIPFTGIDIDWEYPVGPDWGQNIPCDEHDKEGYVLLLSDLRKCLDDAGKQNGRYYTLTTAVPSCAWFTQKNDLKAVGIICDYIKLMNYDYHGSWSKTTGHNANLYKNPECEKQWSSDDGVKALLQAGVPAEKIIFGIPFYAIEWTGVQENGKNGLFQKAEKYTGTFNQTDFSRYEKDYVEYWDEVSKASYLYNPKTESFVSFTSKQMIDEITTYVKENGLGGVMYWEYGNDMDAELLTYVHKKMTEE